MPKVDLNKVNMHDRIINRVVKPDGSIRASKPEIIKENPDTGKAAYVWRMVVFMVSPKPRHQCMPCTAYFDLPAYDENGKWRCQLARKMADSLKPLEDMIINAVDMSEWHGVRRWRGLI